MFNLRNKYFNGSYSVFYRGATALYLLAKELLPNGGTVLVPANICYAAIYPFKYAGIDIAFCDVDKYSGNITLDTLHNSNNMDFQLAIVPHMYGNPVLEMEQIVQCFHEMNVIVIEDCALAMGLKKTHGDYVLYSTGYSKTIDLGFGGLLHGPDSVLKNCENREKALEYRTHDGKVYERFFAKLYRFLRNCNEENELIDSIYCDMYKQSRGLFISKIDIPEKDYVINGITKIEKVIEKRKKNKKLYDKLLNSLKHVCKYSFSKEAIPWRYNLLVDDGYRDILIDSCLKNKVPVSDWYPRVTPLFAEKNNYPNAFWHEKHIVNFPLLISESKIEYICKVVLKTLS